MPNHPATLAEALVRLQAALPVIGKGETADTGKFSYRYADYASILAIVRPLLTQFGLYWSCQPLRHETDGQFVLRYRLVHAATGEQTGGDYPLPENLPAQARGSEITYARRYCLTAILDIALDDDDGKAATDAWTPPAHPHSRKADRHRSDRQGPLPDDDWTGTAPDDTPGSITEGRLKELGYWFTKRGLTDADDRMAYAMSKLDRPELTNSRELSEADGIKLVQHLKDEPE